MYLTLIVTDYSSFTRLQFYFTMPQINSESIQFITASLQLSRHQEGQDRPLVQRTSERRLANFALHCSFQIYTYSSLMQSTLCSQQENSLVSQDTFLLADVLRCMPLNCLKMKETLPTQIRTSKTHYFFYLFRFTKQSINQSSSNHK